MTKRAKQRHAYLTNPQLRHTLTNYLNVRREISDGTLNQQAPLFLSQKGGAFTANSLQKLFHRLYKAAGIVGAKSMSGRRTFITSLINKGTNIKAVSVLAGHSNIQTTIGYVEDNPMLLKRVVEEDVF